MIMRREGMLLAAFVATGATLACGQRGEDDQSERFGRLAQQTDEASQTELVAGIAPARTKTRFRRNLEPAALALRAPVANPPYDFSGTAYAEQARAVDASLPGETPDWPRQPPPGKSRVIYTDLEARQEFEIELDDAEIEQLHKIALERGINSAAGVGAEDEPDDMSPDYQTRGWSNGIDSRISKPINTTYPITHRVLMRMGELNAAGPADGGRCTATLVGRRLVLTAAHCVVPPNLSQPAQKYEARRSNTQLPFGTVYSSGFWWDSQYSGNNCHITYNKIPCARWDWALLLLPSNAWNGSPNGTPGWMGYWVPGTTILSNSYSHNDGYPMCGVPESPSNCTSYPNTVFGQTGGCLASRWDYPELYHFACDAGRGHSGSANWSDYPGSNGPYSLGIFVTQDCDNCINEPVPAEKAYPNAVRTMTSWLAGFITDQRAAFP